jgi:hypothetical protein
MLAASPQAALAWLQVLLAVAGAATTGRGYIFLAGAPTGHNFASAPKIRARSASTKKLSTLGALIDFFARVFDVPSKTGTVIARCLEIVRSTRNDIAADPEPQNRRVDCIIVMAAFGGVCPGDNEELKIAVGPMSPLGATAKQPDLLRVEVSHQPPQHWEA